MTANSAILTRDQAIQVTLRAFTAIARRARSQAEELHPELSLVSYSMLDLIIERGGCRGADLAAYFTLDKSTVSRQVHTLERLGLVARQTDPEDQRGQVLRPSPAGLRAAREANEQARLVLAERFTGWDDDDIAHLAAYLERYNAPDRALAWLEAHPAVEHVILSRRRAPRKRPCDRLVAQRRFWPAGAAVDTGRGAIGDHCRGAHRDLLDVVGSRAHAVGVEGDDRAVMRIGADISQQVDGIETEPAVCVAGEDHVVDLVAPVRPAHEAFVACLQPPQGAAELQGGGGKDRARTSAARALAMTSPRSCVVISPLIIAASPPSKRWSCHLGPVECGHGFLVACG
jgi:DNA-binding MarR family transcriptional regulator